MQDRFEFRAWDKTKEIMVYFDGIFYNKKPYTEGSSFPQYDSCPHYHKLSDLMQCTGLKDKNSKLIYEGDRVYIDCEDETAIIKWSDDLARFTIHFEDEAVFADFDNYYSKELEVIGNIYENSELPKE